MVRPSVEISEAGGKYTMKTLSELKNVEMTFTPGQEFDESTADNRQCKVWYYLITFSAVIHAYKLHAMF